MIAKAAASWIAIANLFLFRKEVAGLQPIPFALSPRDVAASAQPIVELYFQCPVNPTLPPAIKSKVIEQRCRPELTCVLHETVQFVIGGQFQPDPLSEGMITAHFEIVGPFRSNLIVRQVFWLSRRADGVQLGK